MGVDKSEIPTNALVRLIAGWSIDQAVELSQTLNSRGIESRVREDGDPQIAAVWCPESQIEEANRILDEENHFEPISERELARQALAAVGEELTDTEPSSESIPIDSQKSRYETLAYLSLILPIFIIPAWIVYRRCRKSPESKVDSDWSKDQDLLILLFATFGWGIVVILSVASQTFKL